MGHCKICCADRMVVGRWYKLVSHAVGYGVPYHYTVNYTAEGDNVALLHDTVYIKAAGVFTVSCVDMYGNTDRKTIEAIEKPTVSRTEHNITPSGWSDFQSKVSAIGGYALIRITPGTYTFDLTETPFDIPEGTEIDFGGSTVNVTSGVTSYAGFRIAYDFCGLKNATFIGNMLNDETFADSCTVLTIINGDFAEVENVVFNKLAGFNFTIGTWPSYWNFLPSASASRWKAENNVNGYIGDDGSVVSSTESWTMVEASPIINTPDRSFYVGQSNMWIPSYVRLFDIAFYDANMNLVELRKDCQYFRKYFYPESAAYVRYCIWQNEEPTDHSGRDDVCIMRMMAGNDEFSACLSPRDAYIANVVCKNHASGGLSVTGSCEDIHVDRMVARGSGWRNGWAFDAEDGWNSMLGVVVSHSFFDRGAVVFHGCQGLTMLSSICGSMTVNSGIHFPTIINVLAGAFYVRDLRGCATLLNSYCSGVTNSTDYESTYIFGERTAEENNTIRNRLAWFLAVGE